MIQQKTKALGPQHLDVLEARKNYAEALLGDDQYGKAAAEFRSILPIRERVSGPDHDSVQEIRHKLAGIYMEIRKYDQAEVQYRSLLKTQERAGDKEADETLMSPAEAQPFLADAVAAGVIDGQERDLLAAIVAGRSLAEAMGSNLALRRRLKADFDNDIASYIEDLSTRTARFISTQTTRP